MKIPHTRLVSVIAAACGLDRNEVDLYWRRLREDGLAPAGTSGRGGSPALVGPKEAAWLLLALLGSDTARGGPAVARGLSDLQHAGAPVSVTGRPSSIAFPDWPRAALRALELLIPKPFDELPISFVGLEVRRAPTASCIAFQFFSKDPKSPRPFAEVRHGDWRMDFDRGFFRAASIREKSLADIGAAFRATAGAASKPGRAPKKPSAAA